MSFVASPSPKMPSGHRLVRMDMVDSTNAEAKRRADMGEPGPLWISSARQSKGRGRAGRDWVSQVGNLFASLLLRVNCPLQTASQLALVAGIAAYETIAKLIVYEGRANLLLKWPNDVLLAEEKLAGVLIENVGRQGDRGAVVVIGTGINLADYPEGLPQPAISLSAYGLSITPSEALEMLAETTKEWLQRWGEGAMFPTIRRAWLDRAGPLGRPLVVHVNDQEIHGEYAGLDPEGALQLRTADGMHLVTAGDVFFADG